MNNQLLITKEFKILEVEFLGDYLIVAQNVKTKVIYAGLKPIYLGIGMTEGQWQSFTRKITSDIVMNKGIANLQLPTKGGNQKSLCVELDYLPLLLAKISITPSMKQNSPEVVEKLVEYQLKVKDILSNAFLGKTKDWNLQREVGKVDRKRLTNSIQKYVDNMDNYTYAEYTDMVYIALFGMKAKKIREIRNISKKSDLTRDYLTEEELKLVDEAETIVTALISLGFKKDYIIHQLRQKYTKTIETSI